MDYSNHNYLPRSSSDPQPHTRHQEGFTNPHEMSNLSSSQPLDTFPAFQQTDAYSNPHLPSPFTNIPASDPAKARQSSSATPNAPSSSSGHTNESQFDIFDWYPKYQSCQRYFLDHAQHSLPVQAVAAFLNIHLPFQRVPSINFYSSRPGQAGASGPLSPVFGGSSASTATPYATQPPINSSVWPPNLTPARGVSPSASATVISLIPYVRRLVVTAHDHPGVLHGFFGDDWAAGIGPLHEQERRNYLFAAKSGGWASVKKDYDMLPMETVPFLRPLQHVGEGEVRGAEEVWSKWLAMEDWMVGPRAPKEETDESNRPGGRAAEEGEMETGDGSDRVR